MPYIHTTESSLTLKNTSSRTIKVLNQCPIKPTESKDIFKGIAKLSETTVLDALQAPNGSLYKEIYVTKNLKIVGCHLMAFNNSRVQPHNLLSINTPKSGEVLSLDQNGKLKWVPQGDAVNLCCEPPLIEKNNSISIPKADAFTNGYLSREDWILFKGKSKGLRIWQYQDFEGPYTNPVKLSAFSNGEGLNFNKNLIVDGTAVITNAKNHNSAPKNSSKLINKNKIHVTQHIGDAVFLNEEPAKNQATRIYYLTVLPDGVNIPLNYSPPSNYVKKTRIEYFDAIDIDSGGAKNIFGKKSFKDRIIAHDTLSVGGDNRGATLSVSGSITT